MYRYVIESALNKQQVFVFRLLGNITSYSTCTSFYIGRSQFVNKCKSMITSDLFIISNEIHKPKTGGKNSVKLTGGSLY